MLPPLITYCFFLSSPLLSSHNLLLPPLIKYFPSPLFTYCFSPFISSHFVYCCFLLFSHHILFFSHLIFSCLLITSHLISFPLIYSCFLISSHLISSCFSSPMITFCLFLVLFLLLSLLLIYCFSHLISSHLILYHIFSSRVLSFPPTFFSPLITCCFSHLMCSRFLLLPPLLSLHCFFSSHLNSFHLISSFFHRSSYCFSHLVMSHVLFTAFSSPLISY